MIHSINDETVEIYCYFIGTAHDFSDQALNLARTEFKSVGFVRSPSLDSLPVEIQDRPDLVRVLIFNQCQAQSLLSSLDHIQRDFPNAVIALAYRQAAIAKGLLTGIGLCLSQCPIGFLPMNHDLDRWLVVMRLLLCGERYMPSELLAPTTPLQVEGATTKEPVKQENSRPPEPSLTDRETQVLSCIAKGKQNKVIADTLGVSEHTVKLHVHHVIAKLGVNNRTEAAVWYLARQGDMRAI